MEDAVIACPVCGSTNARVVKSAEGGGGWRRRECLDCQSRWTSDEIVRAGSVWRVGEKIPTGKRAPEPLRLVPPLNATGPRAPGISPPGENPQGTNTPSKVSTYISGSGSLTLPLEDPDPERVRSEKRAKRKRTPVPRGLDGTIQYPEDFLALWVATGRKGSKPEALTAWLAKGSPDPVAAALKWTEYLAVLPRWRDPKDLSSWLRADGHTDDYYPGKFGKDRDGAVKETVDDVSKRWLAKHGVGS